MHKKLKLYSPVKLVTMRKTIYLAAEVCTAEVCEKSFWIPQFSIRRLEGCIWYSKTWPRRKQYAEAAFDGGGLRVIFYRKHGGMSQPG